ncbi:hypothetical protein [Streptomyces mutabilis]|uniref:hypothetical protein n=1 Tax=Streptomyces mutabilis TaxID=67332 RepID=UPI00369ECF85
MASSTQTAPSAAWPEGVIARYLTLAGIADPNATVDITDNGEETYWRYALSCAGCSMTDMDSEKDDARRRAQAHAEKCRALPRPTA